MYSGGSLFVKSSAKTFRLWIPLPEKNMLSTGNKTIKGLENPFLKAMFPLDVENRNNAPYGSS